METSVLSLRVDQPARYQIKLLGRLGAHWAEALDDFTLTVSSAAPAGAPAVTTLQGQVADQAALFGLLSRLRDLGLPLLLIECLSGEMPEPSECRNS